MPQGHALMSRASNPCPRGINAIIIAARERVNTAAVRSMIHGEVSQPPLLWIGNPYLNKAEINSSRCYYSNYEDDSVGNLPGRSFMSKRDTDTSNVSPSPMLAQCKHGPSFARVRYK